jgi:uncharacterized protein
MDISRTEQRILHLLAQGGRIEADKSEHGKITAIKCFTRDGWLVADCTLALFKKLWRKDAIASHGGGPYRITRRGLVLVRSQPDNQ